MYDPKTYDPKNVRPETYDPKTGHTIQLRFPACLQPLTEQMSNLLSNWNYDEAFCRNRGLISPDEQKRLRNCRVAIPGMGGVGGIHLMTLVRWVSGNFRVADADSF